MIHLFPFHLRATQQICNLNMSSESRPDLGPPVPANSLSVVLLSRGDGTFHWALGIAVPGSRFAFRKLHATQLKGPSWEFEDAAHDIAEMKARKPVCVVVQIGALWCFKCWSVECATPHRDCATSCTF